MTNYHPDENTLIEFCAGSLDWAINICVATHIEFCPSCQSKVSKYNRIGGCMFVGTERASVSDKSFTSLMSRIKQNELPTGKDHAPTENRIPSQHSHAASTLPKVVQKLIPQEKPLKWRKISPGLRAANLVCGQDKYEVSFHKIKKGSKVAEHDHQGLEVTIVLEGSFSDADGNYSAGDYLVRQPGDIHRPMAAQNEDCLCLSAVAAPVKVTGLFGKLLNPFLSIRPA